MSSVSNLQRLLLVLLLLAIVALHSVSSGVIRFGGDEEDEGSGFGGTGMAPGGESGLGGTGFTPSLGANGAVRIRPAADAPAISEQILARDIQPIPDLGAPLPPPALVELSDFAAEHPAEIAITDQIQWRLQSEALTYQRIREELALAYLPAESPVISFQFEPPAPQPAPIPQPGVNADIGSRPTAATTVEPEPKANEPMATLVSDAADADDTSREDTPTPAAGEISWSELASYLAANQPSSDSTAPRGGENDEAAAEELAVQRPDRVRRPELPQVQRGRLVRRPAILPPRVQPMRF